MNAGSRVKAQQSEDARTKADQEYRSQRDTYNRGRDTTEDQFKRDAIARQDEMNKQGLMQRYGQDLKYAADGSVDLQSSENARNQRALDAQAAEAYGQQSGLGVEGPFPQNVMENPAYPVGAAKGMAEKVRLDNSAKIAEDRNLDRLAEYAIRGAGSEKPPASSEEATLNGVPGYTVNGQFHPFSADQIHYREKQKKAVGGTNSTVMGSVMFAPDGTPIVTRKK
jgi:hypothetical protein